MFQEFRLQEVSIPLQTTEGVKRTPHLARVTHANTFSRVALKISKFASFLGRVILTGAFISHAQCSWLDCILVLPPHSTPSLLSSPNRSIPCDPQQGVPFGRLAEQSPITGYEPNDPVEVGSAEVTTMLLPSRRASIGSTHNSGKGIATARASSEVDVRASPL